MDVKKDIENNLVEILIVEDSPTQAEQLRYLLEEYGYTVNVAANGAEALAMLKEKTPTLVISDIIMPEMDGYALCRAIKADEIFKDIPVMLVTQLSSPNDIVKGLECGADNFIIKPYEERYLLSRIQYILTNQELRKREKTQMGVGIVFGGQKYFITAERQQILDLLLSTYETAVHKNLELIKARDELKELNEQLEKKVEERTTALSEEIAVRKRTEEALLRVNRALKTLGECNQVLVRADEEAALLNEICRIIVESGGYRLAWVGFAEHDDAKRVRPAAQSGYEEGYLEKAQITWADEERGRGPTGTAIRSGKICVVKNILDDPNYAPWREDALERGYNSSISLPLRTDRTVMGVLNIYASRPDAFDPDEVELLTEMAEDLGYGIKSIRASQERKKSEEEVRQKVEELERFRDATIQREFRIKEMKDRVKELEKKLEESARSSSGK